MSFEINQPFVKQEQKFKYWEESKAEIKKLSKQRDELLAALKDIKHRMDDNHLLSRGMVSDICGAAITKVESEK